MKTTKFLIVTLILMLITTFSITGTVRSQSPDAGAMDAQSLRTIENQYIAGIRSKLALQGYENAGITMTRVTEKGRSEYEVLLYHKRLNGLGAREKKAVTDSLLEIEFPLNDCSIIFSFLKN